MRNEKPKILDRSDEIFEKVAGLISPSGREKQVLFVQTYRDQSLREITDKEKEAYQSRVKDIKKAMILKPSDNKSEELLDEFILRSIYGQEPSRIINKMIANHIQYYEYERSLQDAQKLWKSLGQFIKSVSKQHPIQLTLYEKTEREKSWESLEKSLETYTLLTGEHFTHHSGSTWGKETYALEFFGNNFGKAAFFSSRTIHNLLNIFRITNYFIENASEEEIDRALMNDEPLEGNIESIIKKETGLEGITIQEKKFSDIIDNDLISFFEHKKDETIRTMKREDNEINTITYLITLDYIKEYAQMTQQLNDRTAIITLDNIISKELSAIQTKITNSLESSKPTTFEEYYTEFKSRMSYVKELVSKTAALSKKTKYAALYFLNYLSQRKNEESEPFIDMSEEVAVENRTKIDEIDQRLLYGVFMQTGIEIKPKIDNGYYSWAVSPNGEREDWEIKEEISRIMNKYLEQVKKFNDIFENETNEEQPIDNASELAKKFLNIKNNPFILKKNKKYIEQSLEKHLQGTSEKNPYMPLSMFFTSFKKDAPARKKNLIGYQKAIKEELERKQTNDLEDLLRLQLKELFRDPLDKKILNKLLNNWQSKEGKDVLTVQILTYHKMKEVYTEKNDRILASILLTKPQTKNPRKYESILRLLDNDLQVEEFIECSGIESAYLIERKLGEGVTGSTYLAYSEDLKKHRAIKIMDKITKGSKEAEIMAGIEGQELDNIVQIHVAGEEVVNVEGESRYAIVMEYVDGKTLQEIIEEKPLKEEQVLDYSAQLFNGIRNLQNKNLSHYDLHLENIKVNSKGTLKILDFGMSSEKEEVPLSNRLYRPPRHIKKGGDIFSLGLITYTLATGKSLVEEKGKLSTKDFKDKVASMKERMYENGMLKAEYRSKIKENTSKELQNIIINCLENYENPDLVGKAYTDAQEELKYYFMDKQSLINRIKELEK